MGIKPKNHGLKIKVYDYETNGRLLIDSINWLIGMVLSIGYQFEGFKFKFICLIFKGKRWLINNVINYQNFWETKIHQSYVVN